MANEVRPPQPPKLTPEVLAQNNFEQSQLAAQINVPVSAKGMLRARAVIGDFEAIPEKDLSPRQKSQLIEAYSQAGLFQRAYDLSKNEAYLAIANASEKVCDCKDFETTQLDEKRRPVKVTHSHTFKIKNIYKDGKVVGLMRCNRCAHLSIK
jgi:hypothetical protein